MIVKSNDKTLTVIDAPEEGDAFRYIQPYWNGKHNVEKNYDTGMIATKAPQGSKNLLSNRAGETERAGVPCPLIWGKSRLENPEYIAAQNELNRITRLILDNMALANPR